ncbi:AlbA family DNA-binding domain-containing protein [Thermophagus sp. OGC60D27]|uniref:AlbA family DNA-binding domain-containing protein n=1 Tax=Thermophagus sp. OGC60D27 TaxID=3458415 RepID=UPI004037B6F4
MKKRIAEGEHQQQDFKYAINDSKKIARSLAAFANTDGGRLLVGVKDNGRIAGVSSDEEYFMVEAAAKRYCRPPVDFEVKEWHSEGKTVIEIIIPKSENRPHKAPTKEGKYKVYVRVKDQNLLANRVLLKVWMREKRSHGTFVQLQKPEQTLLKWFNDENKFITHSKLSRIAKISRRKAEQILVNLIVLGILDIKVTERGVFYMLKEPPLENTEQDHTRASKI